LDNMLRPHLEALTKFYNENEAILWLLINEIQKKEIVSQASARSKRLRLYKESENFREQGIQFFKAQDFNLALHMYTKSIAAAIDGPLASLAYFNRFH
jgi:hypothetical protein